MELIFRAGLPRTKRHSETQLFTIILALVIVLWPSLLETIPRFSTGFYRRNTIFTPPKAAAGFSVGSAGA